jgi:hypothetical protein
MKRCISAYLLISIPVTPFGMVRWEWFVGEEGIIDLDFIIPIQPETILLNYGKAVKLMISIPVAPSVTVDC